MCRLGALGAAAGKGIQCMSTVERAINVTSKVTAVLSFGMDGFDILAMGYHYLSHPAHWLNLTESCIPIHFTTDFRLLLMRWLRLPPGRHQQ